MKHDHSSAVFQVVRFGLPLVILIFYVSASWNFSYTPDSTFVSLMTARTLAAEGVPGHFPAHPSGVPNPLWVLFMGMATLLRVDTLLAAKIFSLFFSSVAVLLAYLLASEVLRDRFLAFCSALAIATNGYLLQVAPSGSALPMTMTLILAGLFFMLRNDYLQSSLMLALGTLLCWQVAGAFVILLLDAWLNATTARHRIRVILFSVLVFLGTVAPWVVLAALRSVPPFPWLAGFGDFPGISLPTGGGIVVPAVIAVAAAVGALWRGQRDGLARESHAVCILWACWFLVCAAMWGWDFYLFVVPLIVIYVFSSVPQHTLQSHSGTAYAQALTLTAVLILLHQLAFTNVIRPAMAHTEQDSEEFVELAFWIKNGVPDNASVSARNPEPLAYYSGRPVGIWTAESRPSTEYVVAAEEDVWGYDIVYRAPRTGEEDLFSGAGRFAVWRKK